MIMPTVKLPCIARNTPVIRTAVLQIELTSAGSSPRSWFMRWKRT